MRYLTNARVPFVILAVAAALTVGILSTLGVRLLTASPASAGPSAPNPGHPWTEVEGHGIDGSTYWLGTTTDQGLELRVNDSRALRLEPAAESPNIIGGYGGNDITSGVVGATIAGGGRSDGVNQVSADYGTVGGGRGNTAGIDATVGGGGWNTASGGGDTVAGGTHNVAAAGGATVAGGDSNTASGAGATVAGGYSNTATGYTATISGGQSNTASDEGSIGGGYGNVVTDFGGGVGGGRENQAGNADADQANATYATVSGGDGNDATGWLSTVAGGGLNAASGTGAAVGGGRNNVASGPGTTVGGGIGNAASGGHATVGGGDSNTAGANWCTIGGGFSNLVTDDYGMVGGGYNNQAGNNAGTASDAELATVVGGANNTASASRSTIGGGTGNIASGDSAVIGGGNANTASGSRSTIGGGASNTASASSTTVGGGTTNTASGAYATVPGGDWNTAAGSYSFAAGRWAKANNQGCFVWGDSTVGAELACNNNDRFMARASGGVYFYSSSDLSTGSYLAAGSGSWSSVSDRALKNNFTSVDGQTVLASLAEIPIATWNYKAQDASIRHMGPTAQDFSQAFGLGESDTAISSVDADGVALAAIQGLHEIVQEKNAQIADLEGRVAALEAGAGVNGRSPSPVLPGLSPMWLFPTGLFVIGLVVALRRRAGVRP